MPAQSDSRDKNELYFYLHNKGIENRNLFNDEGDYQTFLDYLKDYLAPPPDPEKRKKNFSIKGRTYQGVPHQPKNYFNKVQLLAYHLEPDRFYLLLCQKTKGSLKKLMKSLATRYAIYYNKKYQRTGPVFVGPYKSTPVKKLLHLLYLTYYLHRNLEKGYSSYRDYLGKRKTAWVKPNTILSLFKHEALRNLKSYKNFVEKHRLNQKEKELLERLIIEKEPEVFEKNRPTPVKRDDQTQLKLQQRTPELAIASFVFAILFTSSLLKIWSSSAEPENPVLSFIQQAWQQTAEEAQEQAPEETSEQTLGQTSELEEKTEPKTILVAKLDELTTANIHEGPNTSSKVIAKAKNGDTFEFVSENSGWYEVKLDDGSIAFISADYVELSEVIEERDN